MRTRSLLAAVLLALLGSCGGHLPPLTPAQEAAQEILGAAFADRLEAYHCYRLMGRSLEARKAKEDILAAVAASTTVLTSIQRETVIIAVNQKRSVVNAAERKEKCDKSHGIYELTRDAAPPGGVLPLPTPPLLIDQEPAAFICATARRYA